jgi:prepilin-type N-terminal cleavage/methylation domain-containing protein
MPTHAKKCGFTLAELLVAMGVLGVISTFSIPKILTSTTHAKYNAMAKEMASTVVQAYQNYQVSNRVSSTFNGTLLVPLVNSVTLNTTSNYQVYNEFAVAETHNCGAGWMTCYQMHNGGLLIFFSGNSFGARTNDRFIWVEYDPDGPGTEVGISFRLFFNGKIVSEADGNATGTTFWGGTSTRGPTIGGNPDWWKGWQ